VSASLADIVASAKRSGLDFVVLTPHVREATWAARRGERRRMWRALAREARAIGSPTVIPGTEWTTSRGHFGVVGADLGAIDVDDFLAAAHAAGALIFANHPFAVPTHVPGLAVSDFDMSYRVWSAHERGFTQIDGAEVWNIPLSLANLVSRPGGQTGERRAWTELDRVVHREHRKVVAVAGSDNHRGLPSPTTWVLAADASEPAILDGLRAGRTCVGGSAAGSFRARADNDWVAIGGAVTGEQVTLAWQGRARLFIDDVDAGEHDQGFTHVTGGTLHTYRIELAGSRSGFIYANL
jgi:hypothetical protein